MSSKNFEQFGGHHLFLLNLKSVSEELLASFLVYFYKTSRLLNIKSFGNFLADYFLRKEQGYGCFNPYQKHAFAYITNQLK